MNQESTNNNKDKLKIRVDYDFFNDEKYNTADLYPTFNSNFLQFLILFRFKLAILLCLPIILLMFGLIKTAIVVFCVIFLISLLFFKQFKKAEYHINKMIDLSKQLKIKLLSLSLTF